MAKFDPYELKEIQININEIVDEETGLKICHYTFPATIRKRTFSEYKNGYSNWDGKRNFDGYELQFTRPGGEVVTICDSQRKSVIFEAILREADRLDIMKGDRNRFEKLDRKGK